MKVKLFRKGRFVGLVMPDFHTPDIESRKAKMWEKLDVPILKR